MAQLKLPTVDNFLNYLPLDIGGYVIGVINLAGNAFASILQLRNTISMNLKEFNGESDTCKNSSFYSYNELMSANTVLSTFISFYLLTGVASKDATKILPFLLYVGTYTLTSFIHMMSVNENHVAFGFLLVAFHGYSFLIIYSIFAKILAGKSDDEEPEAEKLVQVDVDKPKNAEKIEKSDKKPEIEKKEQNVDDKKPIEQEKPVQKTDVKKVESKKEKNPAKVVKKPAISQKDVKKAGLKFPKLKKLFHDKVEKAADSMKTKEDEKDEKEPEKVGEIEENSETSAENVEQENDEDENENEEELETLEIIEESDLKDIEEEIQKK